MKEKRPPLKRDPVLIPLSREHHKGLILAQLLKSDTPDYKGLPTDVPGKVTYAKSTYDQILEKHFAREESWLIPLCQDQGELLSNMAKRVLTEHEAIRSGIASLNETSSPESLDQLGRLIEAHIRFEEREWFQTLQQQKLL